MKKLLSLLVGAVLALAACSGDQDAYDATRIGQDNALKVFGVQFDPNQDWNMMKTGQVTITANAPETATFKVAKVQVLTANPFYAASKATILNEATATAGQKVKLAYDAPNHLDTLYAACVSREGYYRVVPFAIGQQEADFASLTAKTRTTRATVAQPTVVTSARPSDNTNQVTAGVAQWVGSNWSDNFYEIDATIEDVADFTDAERTELYNVITGILPENTSNLDQVKESEFYINTGNYFYADGSHQPITVTPVRCGADFLGWESLYYYYYPASVDNLDTEARANYIKALPKFKLLECADGLVGLDKGNSIEERVSYAKRNYNGPWRNVTRRSRTYTMAYFGDGEPTQGQVGTYDFPAGYRIGLMFRVDSFPEHPVWAQGKAPDNTGVLSAVNFYADRYLNNEANRYGRWFYGWNSATRITGDNYLGPDVSRAAVFSANGTAYIGFEDYVDKDFNDVVFQIDGGYTLYEDEIQLDNNVYTMAFEDTPQGDYDLNDVVIKAERVDQTHIKFSLVASGANDELYLRNINGTRLNTTTEVHAIFGQTGRNFINTQSGATPVSPVSETIEVPASFTFADDSYLPYIYNATLRCETRISRRGEDPHGIIIPTDFQYPAERVCVSKAFLQFNTWGAQKVDETDWYLHPEAGKTYTP